MTWVPPGEFATNKRHLFLQAKYFRSRSLRVVCRLEAIPTGVESIAIWLEAIATRVEAIARGHRN